MNRTTLLVANCVGLMVIFGCLQNEDTLHGELIDVSTCSINILDNVSPEACLEPSLIRWSTLPVGGFVGCLLERTGGQFRSLPIRLDNLHNERSFVAPDYLPSRSGTVSILFLDTYDPMTCQGLTNTSSCRTVEDCYLALGPMVIGQHDNFQNANGECLYTTKAETLVTADRICADH